MAKRTASAKKQARAGVRRALRNRGVRSEVKTMVVKARRSLTASPVAESDRVAGTMDAISALDRAAAKGILHPNNAARRKSRLMRQLVKVGGSAPAPSRTTAAKGKKVAASAPSARASKKAAAAASAPAAPASPAPKKPAKK
jgi:small subunit ribosomal protein S20